MKVKEVPALAIKVPVVRNTPLLVLYYRIKHQPDANDIWCRTQAFKNAANRHWTATVVENYAGPLLSLDDPIPRFNIVLHQIVPQLASQPVTPDLLHKILHTILCVLYRDRDTTAGQIQDAVNQWILQNLHAAGWPGAA